MDQPIIYLSNVLIACLLTACSYNTDLKVTSPAGNIEVEITYDKQPGVLNYKVKSLEHEIIASSPLGMNTSVGDFHSGLKIRGHSTDVIDETYRLPQGKTSVYRNHANELTVKCSKEGKELHLVLRAYNDGIAFRYLIPGEGEIEIFGESSAVHLAGSRFTYYGQHHPNRYGYEGSLGPVEADRLSIPVLAHLMDHDHYVLLGQAATNGTYIQPHFQRAGSEFHYSFPLDQEKLGPVITRLPFESPWRMVIISPNDAGRIVESCLVENLNPPTEPAFLKPDGTLQEWIRPGRVMWDYLAGDRDQPRMWIEATAEMGWEYYMADAGFVNRWGGPDSVPGITGYAASKKVGICGWAHTREFNTVEKAAAIMERFAQWGLKGAKIDFFDHNTLSDHPRDWRDYEDTQESLQMRDWIFHLAIENSLLLELHGNTMPTGERRQYPNLMTLEGVDGMERRSKPAANDLTIPFVRNVMGPVSYTIIHLDRHPGTHAHQLAMSIIYEAGMKIYAEHGHKLLAWPGRELIQEIPAAWEETTFIAGEPASHIVLARRKGNTWYIGGMTDEPRSVEIPLGFLEGGRDYEALIFSDLGMTEMQREVLSIHHSDSLSMNMLQRGGFAIRCKPVEP